MDILNTNLMDTENSDLLNVRYYEKHYGASGDSEAEAEGEAESENEDYVDGEGEESEIGNTSDTDLPKFRTLVRNKKLEFKAQYGKAHIAKTYREVCVNVPYTKWDSNINCSSVCVKWNWKLECTERATKCLGGLIGGTRRECANIPYFKWVSGWRKQWREFKRNGGLAQLKLQSKGLAPIEPPVYVPEPTPTPTYVPTPTVTPESQLSCQELADKYKIISGYSWGSATTEVRNEWIKRGCNLSKPEETEQTDETSTEGGSKPKRKTKISKVNRTITEEKILGMPKDVAIGLGVAVALIGGFVVYKKFIAK